MSLHAQILAWACMHAQRGLPVVHCSTLWYSVVAAQNGCISRKRVTFLKSLGMSLHAQILAWARMHTTSSTLQYSVVFCSGCTKRLRFKKRVIFLKSLGMSMHAQILAWACMHAQRGLPCSSSSQFPALLCSSAVLCSTLQHFLLLCCHEKGAHFLHVCCREKGAHFLILEFS